MFPIENRIDWNAIRAEYIGGETIRALSAKYSVSTTSIFKRSKSEGWECDRQTAKNKSCTKVIQKVASSAAENAVIAARIQKAMLLKIERAINKMPMDATEVKVVDGQKTVVFRLRDLASSYKDMTENVKQQEDSDTLKAAKELLGGIPSAID